MRFRNLLAVSISALLVVVGVATSGAAPEAKEVYIIKFADSVNLDNEIAALRAGGSEVVFEYRDVFKGAAALMNSARAAGLSRNPRIQLVEKDSVASVQVDQPISDPALWGLDRIDQVSGTNLNYSYTSVGSNVTAFVIDTGIDIKNIEFEGRAKWGINYAGGSNSDCNGHGTHVAGTIGSKTFGVAKRVNLVAVKVLGCSGSGSYSRIIKGIDWVKGVAAKNSTKDVANMSLGGGFSQALNDAVASLSDSGVVVVVAAGNSATDASLTSPASAPSAITVGASTSGDGVASFSNFGKSIDIFAPGQGIKSTLPGNKVATWNGTSMASPHVAGVIARLLSSGLVSDNIESELKASTSKVTLSPDISSAGTTNILLYADPTK